MPGRRSGDRRRSRTQASSSRFFLSVSYTGSADKEIERLRTLLDDREAMLWEIDTFVSMTASVVAARKGVLTRQRRSASLGAG